MKQPKLNPSKSNGLKMSKKKHKHKLRAMTNAEFCETYACEKNFNCSECSMYYYTSDCELAEDWSLISENPYKTKNGKYILIEVKE